MTTKDDGGRWRRVKEIFEAAVDLAANERARYLDRACGGDAALRTEIDEMIAADSGAAGFMESGAREAGNRSADRPPDRFPS